MGAIEFLNDTFGVDNNVSAPILTSLIVFVTGILANFFIRGVYNYLAKKRIRKSFRLMLTEIIRQCQHKEKHTKLFYPSLTIDHKGNWPMKFFSMSYIEIALKQDFTTIFSSFGHIFRYRNKKTLRLKAFNKIWSTIENLRFYENRILSDFENLFKQFKEFENKYQQQLGELRKHHDQFFQPLIDKPLNPKDFPPNIFNYIKELDGIWHEWEITKNRISNVNRYSKLLVPILELNRKNPTIPWTLEINNILLAAQHEYDQMKNILSINRDLFYSYYINYRGSKRTLSKCMKILK